MRSAFGGQAVTKPPCHIKDISPGYVQKNKGQHTIRLWLVGATQGHEWQPHIPCQVRAVVAKFMERGVCDFCHETNQQARILVFCNLYITFQRHVIHTLETNGTSKQQLERDHRSLSIFHSSFLATLMTHRIQACAARTDIVKHIKW